MKIYKCETCGKIIVILNDSGLPTICCGKNMVELKPATNDDVFYEKHLPEVSIKGDEVIVSIGKVKHPMEALHYIMFVILETNKGFKIKYFKINDNPKTTFKIDDDEKPISIYEYCNIHGLWRVCV